MTGRFMTLTAFGGQPSPMDSLLRLRTYGFKIRFNTNAEGKVDWAGDTLLYGHVKFTVPELRSMIHGLVETARLELMQDLLLLDMDEDGQVKEGSTTAPAICWDSLVDNPAEMKAGWNLFKDSRNTFGGVDGKEWLSGRMVREQRLRRRFINSIAKDTAAPDGYGIAWRIAQVRRYQKAGKSFRQKLLVLAHMTGGMPARGTEIVSVQYMNSPNGEGRGLFVEDG
ncbi:hypothetical protein M501DRAFT_917198, partial [Patellaria atrata CBS 101060]